MNIYTLLSILMHMKFNKLNIDYTTNTKLFLVFYLVLFFSFDNICFSQNGLSVLRVNGRNLIDSCGQIILLRGVNHGNIWTSNFGMSEFPEIAKTGANCVRICLERKYEYYVQGETRLADLTGDILETIIQAALLQKLIPIVELHDFTDGNIDQHDDIKRNLDSAVYFWTKPSILTVLKKHSRFLILNIANEPEHWENTELQFFEACSSAVSAIRATGLKVPIMLDGMLSGTDEKFFQNTDYGKNLLNIDPEQNLLFSVHTYWLQSEVSDYEISERFKNMYESNLPYVIGEFAYALGKTCIYPISYHLMMDLCQQYHIGYLYWWWGFFNPGSNNCLSMTQLGTFDNLSDQGLEVAVTYKNSIKNTSKQSHLFSFGNCVTDWITDNENHEFLISPNPTNGSFLISSDIKFKSVEVFSVNGESIPIIENSNSSFAIFQPTSGVYIVFIKFLDNSYFTKKLVVVDNIIK